MFVRSDTAPATRSNNPQREVETPPTLMSCWAITARTTLFISAIRVGSGTEGQVRVAVDAGGERMQERRHGGPQ